MSDAYLQAILAREAVDTGPNSPVRGVQGILAPLLAEWANVYLISVSPSGSFAKGTANHSGTDIDLFISLSENTVETLQQIYETLFARLVQAGYTPKRQNVSINIRVNTRGQAHGRLSPCRRDHPDQRPAGAQFAPAILPPRSC